MDRALIHYMRVDQLNDKILSTKTQEVKLELSAEWIFEHIKHVNSKDRV